MFYKSKPMLRILCVTLCLFGILPRPAHQVPVGRSFGLLLYPGSVLGSSKPQRVLMPIATSEQNIQQQSSPQTDHSRISPPGMYKPYGLNTNGVFLQPVVGSAPDPTPDPQTFPPESVALQGQMQMSNFLPLNFPMQVYSVGQQAVIADSDSSEEGQTAQVIYLIPVSIESSNMGVMEGTVPNPDPGHLHVQTTTNSPTVTPAAHPEAQLGESVGPEMVTERPHSGKTETLIDRKHGWGIQHELSVKPKPFSSLGNIRK